MSWCQMFHPAWQVLEAFETFKAIRAEQVRQPTVSEFLGFSCCFFGLLCQSGRSGCHAERAQTLRRSDRDMPMCAKRVLELPVAP